MLALAFPSQAFGACPKDERLKSEPLRFAFFSLGTKIAGRGPPLLRLLTVYFLLSTLLRALVVVLHTDDVVFAGVFADLDFNNHERELAFILQAMNRS